MLVTLAALYYRDREEKDEAEYRARGTYDERQADLTARIDTAGDLIGPYATAIALLTGLTMFAPWWATLIPVALLTAFFGYETARAAGKVN